MTGQLRRAAPVPGSWRLGGYVPDMAGGCSHPAGIQLPAATPKFSPRIASVAEKHKAAVGVSRAAAKC